MNQGMNTLLLDPTDVLFFRDGRPMGGSSVGHGDAWPLPSVTNAALHAALWRAGLKPESHAHARKTAGQRGRGTENFGSLATAGPFPVCTKGLARTWFFARPLDAICRADVGNDGTQCGTGKVVTVAAPIPTPSGAASSNPLPFTVASLVPPGKETPDPWWSEGAFARYLGTSPRDAASGRVFTRRNSDFSDSEATIGIGIDAESGTQDGSRFYSAHYLRLREGWKLGLVAATREKTEVRGERNDLITRLVGESGRILVGGQQRLCTLERLDASPGLPLPLGKPDGFSCRHLPDADAGTEEDLVKWVLLSPAIFPRIEAGEKDGLAILPHSGGWLPNWIEDGAGHRVLLKTPVGPRDEANESRESYRERVRKAPRINARLVAAIVGKPLPVTGWSLGTPDHEKESPSARAAGAKPTHLAVPEGSVYYFACATREAAIALAAALNWHGTDPHPTTIRNRRSTLMGEKGFGLGVCGTWDFHPSSDSR